LTFYDIYDSIDIMRQLIIRDIPDDLHKAFKLLCVKQGVSMNKKIIQLIKKVVEKDK